MNPKYTFTKFFLLFAASIFSSETLTYEKVVGTTTHVIAYTVTKAPNGITIISSSQDQTTKAECLPSYQLNSFSCKYLKNNDYTLFTLKEGALTAEGQIKGEKLKETYTLNQTPWVQEFEFGLRPFLASDKSTWYFDIVHPKNFKLYKMVAKKQDTDTIMINNKPVVAKLITITLQGFKSMFWKAQLWYDLNTHDLLLYKSNEGPHTPNVTITLASKTGS